MTLVNGNYYNTCIFDILLEASKASGMEGVKDAWSFNWVFEASYHLRVLHCMVFPVGMLQTIRTL